MDIQKFHSTLVAPVSNLKDHAHNILDIARWFPNAQIAQELTLSRAIELVSQAHGYNSYAALNASQAKDTQPTQSLLKRYQSEGKPLDEDDSYFLTCVDSYLQNLEQVAALTPIYTEPSFLLQWAIQSAFIPQDLFLNLAVINAMGIKLYFNGNYFDQTELKLYRAVPQGGMLHTLISYESDKPSLEPHDQWKFNTHGVMHRLKALSISSVIKHIHIPMPEISKGEIATLGNYDNTVQVEWHSTLFEQLALFIRGDHGYTVNESFVRNNELFLGKCDYLMQPQQIKKAVDIGGVLLNDWLEIKITYKDAEGNEQTDTLPRIHTQYALFLTKHGFRLENPTPASDTLLQRYLGVWKKAAFKVLEQHQHLLGCIWSLYASFDEEQAVRRFVLQVDWDFNRVLAENSGKYRQEAIDNLNSLVSPSLINQLLAPIRHLNRSSDRYKQSADTLLVANPIVKQAIDAEYNRIVERERKKFYIESGLHAGY